MIKIFIILFFTITSDMNLHAQTFFSPPMANTFSIIARDSITGEMGVGVQSHWFSVGSIVGWAEAGVGAVATQSFVNASFGIRGLELLKSGKTPREAVDELIASDEGRDFRQLAILDSKGRTAAYTGKRCVKDAGDIPKDNFSVQANLMLNDKVWGAMSEAFEKSNEPLAERMITALEAGQKAGGDIRGMQSASLLVVKGESTGKVWEDRLIDLRVEDSAEPIKELKRLLKIYRAYEHMNKGDLAVEKNNMNLAMEEYSMAEEMFPDNLEMKFWHAVTLVNNNKLNEALPLFKEVFSKDENWKTLLKRLPASGLLKTDEKSMERILE